MLSTFTIASGSGIVDKEDRMREEVGKVPPRLEERCYR